MVTNVDCKSCSGVGYLRCGSCICNDCIGTGKVKCSDCSNGKIKCTNCVDGKIDCDHCSGYGKTLKENWLTNKLETCISCEGAKQFDCYTCKGSCLTACPSCKGETEIACFSCSNKSKAKDCAECNDTQKIQCDNCLGLGKVGSSLSNPIPMNQPNTGYESTTNKLERNTQVTTRIAFERYGDNIPELPKGIYSINPDRSDCQRILTYGVRPKWSPDGQWIAFQEKTEDNEGLSSIFVMRANGQDVRRVTFHHDIDTTPACWSPDSKKIVYSLWYWQEKLHQICVMDLETGKYTQLTHGKDDNAYPVWTPNNEIVFSKYTDSQQSGHLCIMSPDGRNQRVCDLFIIGDREPVWTYDGKKIVFRREDKFCIMNGDGSEIQTIATHGRIPQMAISPDGQYVAYSSCDDTGESGFEVFVMKLDGTEKKKIVSNPCSKNKEVDSQDISWSPYLGSSQPEVQTQSDFMTSQEAAISNYSSDPTASPAIIRDAIELFEQAEAAWNQENYDEAIRKFDQCLCSNPSPMVAMKAYVNIGVMIHTKYRFGFRRGETVSNEEARWVMRVGICGQKAVEVYKSQISNSPYAGELHELFTQAKSIHQFGSTYCLTKRDDYGSLDFRDDFAALSRINLPPLRSITDEENKQLESMRRSSEEKQQSFFSGSNSSVSTDTSEYKNNQTLPMISLVLGIVGILFICFCGGFPFNIAAIITGLQGMNNANNKPEHYSGRGLAIAGMALGAISSFGTMIFVLKRC